MKEYDLKLTNESIEESLKKDGLNRNIKLNKLIEMLNNVAGNKIISIDGKWGCGKTIFLKQLEFINKNKVEAAELKMEAENIKKFNEAYFVYYYNAWENDFHTSPLLSLIYNLINDFPREKDHIASNKLELPFDLKEALKTISNNLVDINKVKSFKDIASEVYTAEEKKEALNNIINNILPNDKKLIFIIDELDRCKPDYAINMLEVIKHFYSSDKIIFLLGTNNEQLAHTVSNYYGTGFDGYRYLSKFYNLVIELNDVHSSDYLRNVIGIGKTSSYASNALYGVCSYFKFQMRDVNRILNDFDMLNEYFNTATYSLYMEDDILKYIFLPYCIALKIKDRVSLTEFFNGNGYEDLNTFVLSNNKLLDIVKYSLKINDSMEDEKEIQQSDVLKYLRDKYNSYFLNEINDWQIKKLKTMFMDIFSLLSNHTKF